jgi:hypothetical protein
MKKLLFIFLASIIFIPSSHAFRDVTKGSEFDTEVQSLIDKGILKDGTFLRPNFSIPAGMFWEIVLRDAGFNPVSATFGTPLPPNIEESDPLAQFLREGIRRGFIDGDTFASPGFWVLTILGWSATIMGWKMSQGMDSGSLPFWQIAVVLIVIVIASAYFARQ